MRKYKDADDDELIIGVLSRMSIRNNCERDAVLVGVINSATSLYAAIPIFSILGFKATTNYNSCRMR